MIIPSSSIFKNFNYQILNNLTTMAIMVGGGGGLNIIG